MERVYNVVFAANQAASIESVEIKRDDTGVSLWLEAWQSGGASNIHVLEASAGDTLATDQPWARASQPADILMTVPQSGVARRRLPDDVSKVAVLLESAVGATQSQVVTLRVTSD